MEAIDKINFILKQRGMSGADLSRKIGVSNAVYSQWNKKRTKPSNKNLLKVAAALEVQVEDLIDDAKKNPIPVSGDGMEDKEIKEVIDLYLAAPPAVQAAMLAMLRASEAERKVQDAGSASE